MSHPAPRPAPHTAPDAAPHTPRRRLLAGSALAVAQALLGSGCSSTPATPASLPPGQLAQTRRLQVQLQASLSYWLHLPPPLRQGDRSRRWPLVVFLHGSGERGDDLQRVKAHGPPKWLDTQPDFPAIMVSPQAPENGHWDPHLLHALIGQLQAEWPIAPGRITATGLSMGGRGVWAWAIAYPQDLAAIAPVCGEGDEDSVCRIRHLPVWGFHGELDDAVPIAAHRATIQALRDCGGQPRFTAYPDVGHNAWDRAYADPALMAWLLAQGHDAAPR